MNTTLSASTMKFVSFHTHTTYSYADGYGPVENHVDRIVELGMSALGLSEHGNLNSHAALERLCRERGVKPIFGCEIYLGPVGEKGTQAKTHLTIFAMNQVGYHNLNRIITQSYIDSYYFPTVSPSTLKKYNEGILVLSGCSDSLISSTLLGGKFLGPKREPIAENLHVNDTDRKLQWFLDVFGTERFFLEVQRFPKLERTCLLNAEFAKLGKKHGISLVATADVHYPRPEDNKMQALLHNARWQSSPDFLEETAWEYQANLSYPTSDKEIIDDLVHTGLTYHEAEQAVFITSTLAERCTVELPKAKPLRFKCSDGRTADQELRKWIIEGWKHRVSQRPDLSSRKHDYFERLKVELNVIVPKDFCDYFLATADLVNYAKAENVTVGPGRGSAAGSLVCYVIGITEIDPLHPTFSRMIFERFIDKNRSDMPDIDLDFDDELRWKIPARAREVYGHENVANVANHVGYKSKNTLNDVGRAYKLPFKVFDPIGKRAAVRVETDERVDDTILDVLESYRTTPEIAALAEKYALPLAQAVKLEGNEHSMGIHAGGFVVSSDPIPEVCAIYRKTKGTGRKKEQADVIPYEKRDAEYLGMLKMDFLGLTTMGMVGKVRQWIGMSLDELYALFYNAPEYEHERILELFQADDITGIFQYEGGTTRQVTRDVRPTTFDELAACNALSRPGPLYGGQTKEYVAVKRGEKEWTRRGPGFDEHVEWTYGQIVYQEQIMWILRDFAGFPTDRVLKVRKIIGKKLGEFQFRELWAEFRDGCATAHGISEEDAGAVWRGITSAAGYAFNTSHAYSYALIAWWQAMFKIHHPVEFYAATLAKNGDGKDDIPRRTTVLQDCINHHIKIEEFDPNVMAEQWEPGIECGATHYIRPGWRQIPDVGEATAADIVEWRDSRPGIQKVEWWHLADVKGIGENSILKMVEFVGKADPLGVYRTGRQLAGFRRQLARGDFSSSPLPASGKFYNSDEMPERDCHVAWVGLVSNILERNEIEQLRQKNGFSVEEAQQYLAKKGSPDKTKKATLFAYDERGEMALRISRYRYDALHERVTNIATDFHIVVVFGKFYADKPNSIQVENIWILDPD